MRKIEVSGEWDSEQVPVAFEAHGLQCLIVRGPMGALCGYVKLPHEHPLYGVAYNQATPTALKIAVDAVMNGPIGKRGPIDVMCMALGGRDDMHAGMLFDVHGGVTFTGCPHSPDAPQEGFWYGFDCSHSGDYAPGLAGYGYSLRDFEEYRNLAYVRTETESLARQLSQLQALVS